MMELCWGDVGLALTVPRQGLGNAAISAVGTPSRRRSTASAGLPMAITEPGAGSDSAAIRSTARLEGDEWVLNGEKIFVTAGDRADALVVWASIDPVARTRRDQVVSRAARCARAQARPARPQARHPRVGHGDVPPRRLPRPQGEHPGQRRDRHQQVVRRGDEDVRQHAPGRRRDGVRRRAGGARAGARDPRTARGCSPATSARPGSGTPSRPSSRGSRPRSTWRACSR